MVISPDDAIKPTENERQYLHNLEWAVDTELRAKFSESSFVDTLQDTFTSIRKPLLEAFFKRYECVGWKVTPNFVEEARPQQGIPVGYNYVPAQTVRVYKVTFERNSDHVSSRSD